MKKLNEAGYTNLVPAVLAVTITFAILFIGSFITGTISDELTNDYKGLDEKTHGTELDAWRSMNNTSKNWDSALNIVQVVIIITILAMAIGAIFLFTRFR